MKFFIVSSAAYRGVRGQRRSLSSARQPQHSECRPSGWLASGGKYCRSYTMSQPRHRLPDGCSTAVHVPQTLLKFSRERSKKHPTDCMRLWQAGLRTGMRRWQLAHRSGLQGFGACCRARLRIVRLCECLPGLQGVCYCFGLCRIAEFAPLRAEAPLLCLHEADRLRVQGCSTTARSV